MILLFSGGLDSYIAYHYLGWYNPGIKISTLYCDLGHRYAVHEVEKVKELIPTTIIDTRLNLADWEEKDANIPMRNAFLSMIASHYDREIILVVQKGEMEIPDRTQKFMEDISKLITRLKVPSRACKIWSPFTQMTKASMVQWYLITGLSEQKLLKTRSCYSAGEKPCGKCSACFRRWVAMSLNDLHEEYESPILLNEKIPDYIRKMMKGKYDAQRTAETLAALIKAGYDVDRYITG